MEETQLYERVALLEHRISLVEQQYQSIDSKLDQLMALKDKGFGAFWLATGVIGFFGMSIFNNVRDWVKGW